MDPSGQLFAHELEALRMELGTPDAITDHDYKQFEQCVTYCWLKTLWQFCRQHHFRFDDPFERPRLHREGDQYLMHAFALHHFKPKELAMINQCRMFLKVITLADITTANGKSLHPWSYDGIRRRPHLHRYHWPRQPKKLSEAHWQLWRKALDACF
jgi:hypothetical protein